MSASIATLTPDCIANVVHYLNGDDFASLMQTGNRLLRHKLANNCFGLFFQSLNNTKFPFAALKLPKLRSLVVHGPDHNLIYMDFRNRGETALIQGSNSIEKIELRFLNAIALFLSPGKSLPRQLVRDRFPSLTTLTLHGVTCDEPLDILFGELPKNLQSLSLKYCLEDRETAFISLSSIAKLPRNLQTLKLVNCTINGPEKELENILPPNLTHLRLETVETLALMDHLPSTLKILRFSSLIQGDTLPWKFSKIPPGLISLRTSLTVRYLHVDAPLPSNLEKFHYITSFREEDNLSTETLPKNLKYLSYPTFLWGEDQERHVNRFKKLESTTIYFDTTVALLPESVKSLKCKKPLRIDCALPSGLKRLSLLFPVPSENLKNIPSSLTSLKVVPGHLWGSPELKLQFPPWTESEFAQIASRMRLVSLFIDWDHIQSASCLAPLAKVETLKIFEIYDVSAQSARVAPQWLPKCLSSNLRELKITFASDSDYTESLKVEKNFWSLIALSKVVPHLKSFTLDCYDGVKHILDPTFFASLPPGLINLKLFFSCAELTLGALSQLPKYLQYVYLDLNDMDSSEVLSDYHFQGLPPSLSEFLFLHDQETTAMTPKVFDILPSSIIFLEWPTLADNDEFEARKEKFLWSNPNAEGFRLQRY